jgi:hypothetical protein
MKTMCSSAPTHNPCVKFASPSGFRPLAVAPYAELSAVTPEQRDDINNKTGDMFKRVLTLATCGLLFGITFLDDVWA